MAGEPKIELDAVQQAMLDYWRAVKGEDATPTVDALDPLAFDRRALPYLLVADYLNDQGLIRYRLIGEEVVRRWGINFSGKRSDEMFTGDYRVYLERCFALARSERCPVYSESIFRWNDGGWTRTSRLLLPFSAEPGGVPVRVVAVQVFMPNQTGRVDPEIRLLRPDAMSGGVVVAMPVGPQANRAR